MDITDPRTEMIISDFTKRLMPNFPGMRVDYDLEVEILKLLVQDNALVPAKDMTGVWTGQKYTVRLSRDFDPEFEDDQGVVLETLWV